MLKIIQSFFIIFSLFTSAAFADHPVKVKQHTRFHSFIPGDPDFRVDPDPVWRTHAKLVRKKNKLKFTLHSRNLPSGAYSIWMRVFNRPDLCVGGEDIKGSMCSRWQDVAPNPFPCIADENGLSSCSVFWVGSTIVGDDGIAHVSKSLEKNNWPGMVLLGVDALDTDNQGVWNMFGSEIHVIFRYHGPEAYAQGPVFNFDPVASELIPVSEQEKEAFILLGRQLNRHDGNCSPLYEEDPSNCSDEQLAIFPGVK